MLTGSTNFTPTGVGADAKHGGNLNHVVIVHDREVARIYGREFREIRQGRFGKLNEGHDPAPPDVSVSGVPIRVDFAPDHNPEMEIMKQMLKARERIDFAIFTFSESSGMDDGMIALTRQGLQVRGAVDGMSVNQEWAATRPVQNAGAVLYRVPLSDRVNKIHHKLMVVDDQVIVAGSFSYTGPATRLNDENIVIIGDLDSTDAESIKRQQRIAAYAKSEVDRIIEEHGELLKRTLLVGRQRNYSGGRQWYCLVVGFGICSQWHTTSTQVRGINWLGLEGYRSASSTMRVRVG